MLINITAAMLINNSKHNITAKEEPSDAFVLVDCRQSKVPSSPCVDCFRLSSGSENETETQLQLLPVYKCHSNMHIAYINDPLAYINDPLTYINFLLIQVCSVFPRTPF